jgi:two-component system nitrate/nitrite sensor histidine kinase NarX
LDSVHSRKAGKSVIREALTNRATAENMLMEMSVLSVFAEMINRTLNLDDILQLALEMSTKMVAMNQGGILLLNPSTDELFLRAHIGVSPELVGVSSYARTDEGMLSRMLASVLIIDDLSEVTEKRRAALEKEGLQFLISVPLTNDSSALGVMVLADHQRRRVRAHELRPLAIIGHHVGSAIHRVELQARELRVAILEERHAMAQQMHDDIAQTLGYLGLQVDNVMDTPSLARNAQVQADLEEVRTAIENAYQRVRASITRLSKDIPDDFDLRTALQETIDEFGEPAGYNVKLETSVDWRVLMSPLVAIQAHHIIHEALTNTRKHAEADTVHVALQRSGDEMIEITIWDNGQGFDIESVPRSINGGFGLRFMAERAERVGGTFRVESRPGHGTQIVVRLPAG